MKLLYSFKIQLRYPGLELSQEKVPEKEPLLYEHLISLNGNPLCDR